jgi:hypothetical protein
MGNFHQPKKGRQLLLLQQKMIHQAQEEALEEEEERKDIKNIIKNALTKDELTNVAQNAESIRELCVYYKIHNFHYIYKPVFPLRLLKIISCFNIE